MGILAQGSRACAHFHRLIDMGKKTTTPKAKTTKPTKATLKKITAVKRAAGKKAKKAAGKANALAMKKKGVGIFAPKVLSPALAPSVVGRRWRARRLRRRSGPTSRRTL